MKKRGLALWMAGALALGMLQGCGTKSSGGETESAGSETSAKEETLTVWCWDPNYNMNALHVAEGIYQREHPDFKLDIKEIDAKSISEKLATSTSASELKQIPDIILFDDSSFQRNVVSYPDIFLDLTDYGFNYDEFSPGKVGMSVVDGKNYGIPFDSGTAIACYRTDILEQAGYTIDDFTDITWSEWLEKAEVVLEKTGCPLLNGLGSYNQLTIMLQSAGGSFFNEDGTPNLTDNAALKETIDVYVQMVQAGVYTEEAGWDTYIGGLNTGRVAGAMNGCWIMSSIEAASDQSGKWAITNIPRLEGTDGATNYSSQGGSTWAITTLCDTPELAVDFFKSTFGGSTELYDEILETGAISTWIPAAESEKYEEPMEFFGGQPVFSMITEYSAHVPECYVGVYFANANNDVVNAITNIIYSGENTDDALQEAQATLEFEMEQ